MKKIGILNSQIAKVISELGHTDQIVICDSGLPIPDHVKRIDLALRKGIPSFMDTLETVLMEMEVEKVILAVEMAQTSPALKENIDSVLNEVEQLLISHEEFKVQIQKAKAVIRTGEFTPYANIILQAGVIF